MDAGSSDKGSEATFRIADERQADYFRAELQRRIDEVDLQIRIYDQALQAAGRSETQIRRYRHERYTLRHTRAELARMLTRLDGRFPAQK
jgi:hypothetical protein